MTLSNPITCIIFGGVLTGVSLAACVAFADGPGNPWERPKIIEPENLKVRQCPPHSDTPHATYRNPWVRNCFEKEREPEREVECTMNNWTPGVMLARGYKEKECA